MKTAAHAVRSAVRALEAEWFASCISEAPPGLANRPAFRGGFAPLGSALFNSFRVVMRSDLEQTRQHAHEAASARFQMQTEQRWVAIKGGGWWIYG